MFLPYPFLLLLRLFLANTDVQISSCIECSGAHASKISRTWKRDANQACEEILRPSAPKRHHDAGGHAFTELEGGNGFSGGANRRTLAGDTSEIPLNGFQRLLPLCYDPFPPAGIHHNTIDTWQCERVRLAKALAQLLFECCVRKCRHKN